MHRPDVEAATSTGPRWRMPAAGVAALLAMVVGASVGLTGGRGTTPNTSVSPSPSEAIGLTSEAPLSPSGIAPSPFHAARPSWVIDLAGQLDCDGPIAGFGQEVPSNLGPFEPGGTPDQALDIARMNYWNLPATGFEPPVIEGAWARHRYAVGDRVKAIAVSTRWNPDIDPETGWEVVGLRACDPAEFDAGDLGPRAGTVWRDANGDPVRTDVITSYPGPGHCGWETTVFLSFGGAQFFRDPKHVLKEYSVVTFDASSRLPADGVDTGLHTNEWHIFTIPSGRAVFVRTDGGPIERWPRSSQEVGCA
jgi:hypothetical protein